MTNLEKVLFYFNDYESPTHFLVWDFVYMISSCLGRRVQLQEGEPIFANEFIVIVGPPAVGKSLPARRLGHSLSSIIVADQDKKPRPMVNLVASCVTLERLYEVMEGFSEIYKVGDRPPVIHSSASFMLADEMGLLFKHKDSVNDLIMFLIAGYDCTPHFQYETKKNGTNIIQNMCLNFFGCCTPTWISKNFTQDVLELGLGSRIIFVWGEDKRKNTTFLRFTPEQDKALAEVREHFKLLHKVKGEMKMTQEAYEFLDHWVQHEQEKYKINKDPKLQYYYSRKKIHLIKLAMILHFMEKLDMTLTIDDFKASLQLLGETEKDMHKALASINQNPLATLAENIRRDIETSKGMRLVELVARHFNQAPIADINEAIAWLSQTGIIHYNSGAQKFEMVKPTQQFEQNTAQLQ